MPYYPKAIINAKFSPESKPPVTVNAPVPAGSSLEIISGSKIIMESSDVLQVRSGTASALDVAVSYLEQT